MAKAVDNRQSREAESELVGDFEPLRLQGMTLREQVGCGGRFYPSCCEVTSVVALVVSILALMLGVAALVSVLAGQARGADMELIEFKASWCDYCRAIEPDVQRLIKQGFAIRQIDVDDLAVGGSQDNGAQMLDKYYSMIDPPAPQEPLPRLIPALFLQTYNDDGSIRRVTRVSSENSAQLLPRLRQAGMVPKPKDKS